MSNRWERFDPYRISTPFRFARSKLRANNGEGFRVSRASKAVCLLPGNKKTPKGAFLFLCRERDSNSQVLRRTILSRVRIPFRHPGMSFNLL